MKPFKIICHNDLDGGVSAICIINHILAKYGEGADWTLAFKTYTNINQYVERIIDQANKFSKVFIADISVEEYLAKEFPSNFVLLDHHDTAAHLNGIHNCIVNTDGNDCGATLCLRHLLIDEGLPYKHLLKLVAIAKDYDLWIHKLPNKVAKNLNFLYYKYWGERFVKRFIEGFDGYEPEEKTFLKNKWDDVHTEIEECNIIDMLEEEPKHKNKFALVVLKNSKSEVNEICEYVLNELHYNVVITVNTKQKKISIRADSNAEEKGFHVGEINSELEIGGGHARAGGASFTDDDHLEVICEAYSNKIIDIGL